MVTMTTVADLANVISPGFTENILNDIVRKKSGFQNVTVQKIKLGDSSKKGDSYLSNVTRLTIEASGNNGSGDSKHFQIHTIVKSIPFSEARAKSFRSADFFADEIDFYNKVWPVLDAFQKSKNLPEPFNSIPLCLATYTNGKNDFIAFDDLSYQGFVPLDRSSSGLDLDTTLFILRNFAKFHGLSVAYRDQNPAEFQVLDDSLQETYFDEKHRKWYEGSMSKFLIVVKDAAEKELPPTYLKKLEEMSSQDLYGNICKLLKKRTTLCAITHGDCWPPNFLIQESNNVKNLALIDFQLMRAASLTTDILFLLCTCVDPSVRNQYWELLLGEYHKTFVATLMDLGSKLDVSLDLLKEEIKMNGLFAFGMCNEALVMSLMDDEDVADLEAIEGSEGIPLHEIWHIEPAKDKEKRQRIADYIKHLIDYEII